MPALTNEERVRIMMGGDAAYSAITGLTPYRGPTFDQAMNPTARPPAAAAPPPAVKPPVVAPPPDKPDEEPHGGGNRNTNVDAELAAYGRRAEELFDPNSPANVALRESIGKYNQRVDEVAARPKGYTEEEQRALKLGALMPVAASFKQASADNRARAVRTGNLSASGAGEAELARERARTTSVASAGVTMDIAGARREDTKFYDELVPGLTAGGVDLQLKSAANSRENLAALQFPTLVKTDLYKTNVTADIEKRRLEENARQFGITEKRLTEGMTQQNKQFYDSLGTQDKQFYAGLGSEEKRFYEGLNTQDRQFYAGLNSNERIEYSRMSQQDKQFYAGLNQNDRQFYAGLSAQDKQFFAGLNQQERIEFARLGQQDRQFYAGLDSDEKKFFAGISSDEKKFFANLEQDDRQFYKYLDTTDRQFYAKLDKENPGLGRTILNSLANSIVPAIGGAASKFLTGLIPGGAAAVTAATAAGTAITLSPAAITAATSGLALGVTPSAAAAAGLATTPAGVASGSFMSSLGALATNPITIGVAAALAIGATWLKSQAHWEANSIVQNFENPFFNEFIKPTHDGMFALAEAGTMTKASGEAALTALTSGFDLYKIKVEEWAKGSSDKKTVKDQSIANLQTHLNVIRASMRSAIDNYGIG